MEQVGAQGAAQLGAQAAGAQAAGAAQLGAAQLGAQLWPQLLQQLFLQQLSLGMWHFGRHSFGHLNLGIFQQLLWPQPLLQQAFALQQAAGAAQVGAQAAGAAQVGAQAAGAQAAGAAHAGAQAAGAAQVGAHAAGAAQLGAHAFAHGAAQLGAGQQEWWSNSPAVAVPATPSNMARDNIHFISGISSRTCLTVVSSCRRTGHSPDEATQLKAHRDSVVTTTQIGRLTRESHLKCVNDLGSQKPPVKMSKVPTLPPDDLRN